MLKTIFGFIKENLSFYVFILIATLFIGVTFTSADFFTAPFHSLKDGFVLFAQWAILMLVLSSVIYLMSLNKYVFAVVFPVMTFFSSILMYFRYTAGTIYTTMILDSALDNDTQITLELIGPGLIFTVLGSVCVAGGFVYYRLCKIKVSHIYIHTIIAFSFLILMFNIPRIKNPVKERIPFNLYYITSRYFSEKQEALKVREPLPAPYNCGMDTDLNVVFILGESLRPDHLGINGYERNTTPYLSEEDIISFPNIYSEYTHTNASLPHILTPANDANPDLAYTSRSFIDLFKACDYYTAWLGNQEPAKSYVYFMHECDTLIYANTNKSTYVFDKWIDEDLLPSYKDILKSNNGNKLIIMHTIGSHWYYNSHFSDEFKKYTPTTKSRVISSNTREEMINSYDNTVLYTDYFIYQVINTLRNKNAILIYLSDHGESLGEDGAWLHASTGGFTHCPASFIWMSATYRENHPERYDALQKNKNKNYSTEFLFHTITEAAGIESEIIVSSLSLFH